MIKKEGGLLTAAFRALDLAAAVTLRGVRVTASLSTLLHAAATEDRRAGFSRARGERSETEAKSEKRSE